jgi:hypothetical protein
VTIDYLTRTVRFLVFVGMAICYGHVATAQTLAPRAYVITPVDGNVVTLSWSFYNGGLNLDGAIPVTGATGTYNVQALSYYHSFSLFGRSANITGLLPYGVATFRARFRALKLRFIAPGCWTVVSAFR